MQVMTEKWFTSIENAADKTDVLPILRGLGFLEDGVEDQLVLHQIITSTFYEEAPEDRCWYPRRETGEGICRRETLGEIRDIFRTILTQPYAKVSGVILYQTASLGIEKGTPMVAYGKLVNYGKRKRWKNTLHFLSKRLAKFEYMFYNLFR